MNRYAFPRNAETIKRDAKRLRDSIFRDLRDHARLVEAIAIIAPASNNPDFTLREAARLAEEARAMCADAMRPGSVLNPIRPEY